MIEHAGTGLLKFTGNVTAVAITGGGSKTLTLQGNAGTSGELAGVVRNASAASVTNLAKAGGGTFAVTGGTLDLGDSAAIDYAATYPLLTGFGTGTVSGLTITGYDTAGYTAALSNAGVLSFTAVPEPAALAFLGVAATTLIRRRRSR